MKLSQVKSKLRAATKDSGAAYRDVETRFLIERTVARLVLDPLVSRHLVFKGGFVALTVYGSSRYTTDLDALAYSTSLAEIISSCEKALSNDLGDHVWFAYERSIDLQAQGEYGGTRLRYRFGLGEKPATLQRAQILNLDIGVGDPVTPAPETTQLPQVFGEDPISWLVYPPETIVAEKLHPLVALGALNSRSKDVYDLVHFLPLVDPNKLKHAITATFAYRKDPIPSDIAQYLKGMDTSVLKRGWDSAIQSVHPQPSFESCFAFVIDWFDDHQAQL